MEQPFSEAEKRWVLSEAIKTSSIPIERLLLVLNEANISPCWEEMLLPQGRNLKSCMDAFAAITRSSPGSSLSILPPSSFQTFAGPQKRKSGGNTLEPFSAGPTPKRRQSGADPIASSRIIQPKPSLDGSPSLSTLSTGQQPKKRGRPSKAEVEARNAEAIARGEVIPPPRTPGGRNPQVIQFDSRSPVQRDIAPSPKPLTPGVQVGGDIGSFPMNMNIIGQSTLLTTNPPLEGSPSLSSFPTTTNIAGPATTFPPMAPMASMTNMNPASPVIPRVEEAPVESEALTSSGKKKRTRPASKPVKAPNIGESSFQTSNSQIGQFQPTTAPINEQESSAQATFPTKSEAEKPQANPAPTSQTDTQLPPSIQRPDT